MSLVAVWSVQLCQRPRDRPRLFSTCLEYIETWTGQPGSGGPWRLQQTWPKPLRAAPKSSQVLLASRSLSAALAGSALLRQAGTRVVLLYSRPFQRLGRPSDRFRSLIPTASPRPGGSCTPGPGVADAAVAGRGAQGLVGRRSRKRILLLCSF